MPYNTAIRGFGLLLVFLLHAAFLHAQQNGSVSGRVTDPDGMPIQQVTVILRNGAQTLATAHTAPDGSFRFPEIPFGSYTLVATHLTYGSQTLEIQHASANLTLQVTLQLHDRKIDEINIIGETDKRRLENSADAITVVETREVRFQAADMGQVLAQTQGVGVRRSGGLGSSAEFSLAGLTANQIRFFIDGIHLALNGYTFGLSTVPVNLVERIEIYKGVVPIAFGADALGGAVNIVTPRQKTGTHGGASYQVGSFGTNRLTANIGVADSLTGLFVRGEGYYDHVYNNYTVHVGVADERGKETVVEVPRFHDRYVAGGGNLTLGLRDKPWAEQLSVRGFYHRYTKEIQHNELMSGIPYGEVMSYRHTYGTSLNYRMAVSPKVAIQLSTGYSQAEREFVDTSRNVYNWYGDVVLVKNRAGEIGGGTSGAGAATQAFAYTRSFYTRASTRWVLSPADEVQISIAPTVNWRTGADRRVQGYDPLTAQRRLLGWVNGISYTRGGGQHRLENTLFAKHYLQGIHADEATTGTTSYTVTRRVHYWGVGDGLCYRISDRLVGKASYEYAARLPQEDELFGDGQFTLDNMGLVPERSHNVNLGLAFSNPIASAATWRVQANGFMRNVSQLILFVPGSERTSRYENVSNANSMGAEVEASWTSPSRRLYLAANSTYQDFYNNSHEGLFEPFYGDRIPNRPYFFANASLRYTLPGAIMGNDQLAFFGHGSYIHAFYRSWESAGLREYKIEIPAQQQYTAGLTYRLRRSAQHYVLSAEVQNITNQRNYDYYGIEKPGRAFYLKLATEF